MMTPCPFKPTGPGPLPTFVRWVEAELKAAQILSVPGMKVSRSPRGTVVQADRAAGAGGVQFQWLTTVREGFDAVECLSGSGATVYCLKPQSFRAQGYIWDSGDPFGSVSLETWTVVSTGVETGATTAPFKQAMEIPSAASNNPFVVRYIKGRSADDGAANTWFDNSTLIGSSAWRIGPHYVERVNGVNTGSELLAASRADVLIDLDDLRIGGAEDGIASFVDVSARYWEPLNTFLNVTLLHQRTDGYAQSDHGLVGGSVPFP